MTKPWEEIRVGPGINKGFGSRRISNGFNSSLESRGVNGLIKRVDELRTANNPKA